MKIKLDENLGLKAATLLRKAGHDVATVPEQKLCSAPDRDIIKICHSEKRCLVTMDLDFANPLLFNPSDYSGIAVIRLHGQSTPENIIQAFKKLISALSKSAINQKLWIVEPDRIREYQSEQETKQ